MSMLYTDIISWHFKGNIELCILENLEKFPISPLFLSLVVGFMTVKVGFVSDIRSDQIRSVAQSCPTLCDPMNRSTPGLPVHHQLPEFTQIHVHRVSDASSILGTY